MRRAALTISIIAMSFACIGAGSQTGVHELNSDVSLSGLIPVTWASDGPTLPHIGISALIGFEYDSPISLPFRFELGYLGASASRIAPSGELYRGWAGMRIALLSGYNFGFIPLGRVGNIAISLLGGGAVTAASYAGTALAYAYPSLVLEPRAYLSLRSAQYRGLVHGPWLAIPVELMFRAGIHTLAPGLSLGWRYRLKAVL